MDNRGLARVPSKPRLGRRLKVTCAENFLIDFRRLISMHE